MLLDMLFALDAGRARLRARHARALPRDLRRLARGRAALRHEGRGLRGPVARAAGRSSTATRSGSASPTSAARSARSSRSAARSAGSTPGSPGCAATSRRRARTRRRSAGTRRTSSGRRTRSPTGTTSAAGTTSASAACPYNALHDRGYASIGCTHCTQPGAGREGRWAGRRTRRECGLHSGDREWRSGVSTASSSGSPGCPAAGKSTIAGLVAAELEQRGVLVDRLDGDVVREHLTKGLGFSKEDRDTNIARIGWVASRLARAGAAVVVSAISPYEEARQQARALDRGARAVRRGLRRHLARGVRAPRPEGPLREGARRRDRRVHRRLRPVRGAVESRAAARTPRAARRAVRALVLAKLEELGLISDEVAA